MKTLVLTATFALSFTVTSAFATAPYCYADEYGNRTCYSQPQYFRDSNRARERERHTQCHTHANGSVSCYTY